MAIKTATEIHTPSTVSADLSDTMQRAFRRLRDEQDLPTDDATATFAGLPTTYIHWLGCRRPWTEEGMCRVAAGLNCTVGEMLMLVEVAS